MAHSYFQPVLDHFDMDKYADVDDELFLQNTQMSGNTRAPPRSTNPFDYDEDELSESSSVATQRLAYAEKRRDIEQRTLDSTQKSLVLLYETEEVGKATAAELARQREQLEKTAHNLDEISSTLRYSQRHLNGLKSVFGGLQNYLAGCRDQAPTATGSPTSSQDANNYPSDVTGGAVPKQHISPTERSRSASSSYRQQRPAQAQAQAEQHATNPFQQQLESNLDDMCDNLSRLKFLASDLGTEIKSQNGLLDNMNYQMESVDLKVNKQNKEINKLIKK